MRAMSVCCLLLLSTAAWAEDYPTQDTVEQVILCMADIGGQSEENLYTCACRHDVIKERVTFKEYEGASIVERYRDMPADKGQAIRDNKDAHKMLEKLEAARKDAAVQCPLVKHISAPPSSN